MRKRQFLYIVLMFLCLPITMVNATPQEDFFQKLLPAIKKTRQSVIAERKRLQRIYSEFKANKSLSNSDKAYVMALAKDYNLAQMNLTRQDDWKELLKRVDVIPTSMVLAQAADESAWGRSRFARLGHNYFGQWCYTKGCGIVPSRRSKGAHHEVQKFKDSADAIKHYFHNLNTGHAYEKLRSIRASLRAHNKALSGAQIARGLERYSALGQKYVLDIQSIIRRYHLEQYDIA